MDVLNLFSSTKKKEEIERDNIERDKILIERNERHRIETAIERPKIIQPLDVDKMDDFKNRTILFLYQCQKKQYIYDYFQRMSSNIFLIKNNCRPFLAELEVIIRKTIPKSEENQLRILMNNLEYNDILNKDILARTHSTVIIDTLYDFCKSVDKSIDEINEI
jgi:hypothetical protein